MFDHIPDTLFWPLWALLAFLVALAVGLAFGALIRWCDTPSNKYVDRVDVERCERRGSQAEFSRRLRARGVR